MEDSCAECGFDESSTPPAGVVTGLDRVTPRICAAIRAVPPQRLRQRPDSATWAPIEYLGHLRESMAFHRWLIERALAEEDPAIPIVDPDQSVADAGYIDADLDELVGQFERRILRLTDRLTVLPHGADQRRLTLGDLRITVALVARSAWHECHHHLGDIRRLGGLGPEH
jgi:hypothetical protein